MLIATKRLKFSKNDAGPTGQAEEDEHDDDRYLCLPSNDGRTEAKAKHAIDHKFAKKVSHC